MQPGRGSPETPQQKGRTAHVRCFITPLLHSLCCYIHPCYIAYVVISHTATSHMVVISHTVKSHIPSM
jgi:hypothetical protein